MRNYDSISESSSDSESSSCDYISKSSSRIHSKKKRGHHSKSRSRSHHKNRMTSNTISQHSSIANEMNGCDDEMSEITTTQAIMNINDSETSMEKLPNLL